MIATSSFLLAGVLLLSTPLREVLCVAEHDEGWGVPAEPRTSSTASGFLRKVLSALSSVEAMELLLERLAKTKSNKDFLESMSVGR